MLFREHFTFFGTAVGKGVLHSFVHPSGVLCFGLPGQAGWNDGRQRRLRLICRNTLIGINCPKVRFIEGQIDSDRHFLASQGVDRIRGHLKRTTVVFTETDNAALKAKILNIAENQTSLGIGPHRNAMDWNSRGPPLDEIALLIKPDRRVNRRTFQICPRNIEQRMINATFMGKCGRRFDGGTMCAVPTKSVLKHDRSFWHRPHGLCFRHLGFNVELRVFSF